MVKYCSNCGKEIIESANFCRYCGKAMKQRQRYKCNSCGSIQLDGAWETVMDTQAKAMGAKGFVNIGADPQCLNCGSLDLIDLWNPSIEKPRIEVKNEQRMVNTLSRLCQAYMRNDRSSIEELEPIAREIGVELNRVGGINEMRRVFKKLNRMPGSRTLEMHWGGIGEWRS